MKPPVVAAATTGVAAPPRWSRKPQSIAMWWAPPRSNRRLRGGQRHCRGRRGRGRGRGRGGGGRERGLVLLLRRTGEEDDSGDMERCSADEKDARFEPFDERLEEEDAEDDCCCCCCCCFIPASSCVRSRLSCCSVLISLSFRCCWIFCLLFLWPTRSAFVAVRSLARSVCSFSCSRTVSSAASAAARSKASSSIACERAAASSAASFALRGANASQPPRGLPAPPRPPRKRVALLLQLAACSVRTPASRRRRAGSARALRRAAPCAPSGSPSPPQAPPRGLCSLTAVAASPALASARARAAGNRPTSFRPFSSARAASGADSLSLAPAPLRP